MRIKPLGVVVEQEYHLVLYVDFRKAFRELDQIAGSRKRVAFANVNEAEEVCNSGSQHRQSASLRVRVRSRDTWVQTARVPLPSSCERRAVKKRAVDTGASVGTARHRCQAESFACWSASGSSQYREVGQCPGILIRPQRRDTGILRRLSIPEKRHSRLTAKDPSLRTIRQLNRKTALSRRDRTFLTVLICRAFCDHGPTLE
jgi:hypothetical protein